MQEHPLDERVELRGVLVRCGHRGVGGDGACGAGVAGGLGARGGWGADVLNLVMTLAVAPAPTTGTGRLSYPISGQYMR